MSLTEQIATRMRGLGWKLREDPERSGHLAPGQHQARWADADEDLAVELLFVPGHGHGVVHYLIDADLLRKHAAGDLVTADRLDVGDDGIIIRTVIAAIGPNTQEPVDHIDLSAGARKALTSLLAKDPA